MRITHNLAMKRVAATGVNHQEKRAKRQISVKCFEKWQGQYNREHQTLSWLKCTKDKDHSLVAYLWCEICRQESAALKTTAR